MFGELLCEELYNILGKNPHKPECKEHYQPDFETDNEIIEVKTQTYLTDGTAGEKILGCPFKYSEIPFLYNKPLKIVCLGGAEKLSRERYGNLPGKKTNNIKNNFLEFYKLHQIEFIGFSELLIYAFNNSSINSFIDSKNSSDNNSVDELIDELLEFL